MTPFATRLQMLTRLMIVSAAFLFAFASTAQAQTIIFTFDNIGFSGDGSRFEFDVMAAAPGGEFFGDSQIYINYNTAGFGSGIAAQAQVTEGTLMQDVIGDFHTIVGTTDNSTDILAITTDFIPDGSSQFSTQMSSTPQQILRISLPIADPNQNAGLSFNAGLMTGQQFPASDGNNAFDDLQATDTDDTPLRDPNLPIELSSFTANPEPEAVVLDWTTASETDNAGFEIQQQLAPVEGGEAQWETLAFVEGAGTTTEAKTYRYRLDTDALGKQQFRLKQLDFDGQYSYSETIEVEVELATAYRLSDAYPNPFNPQTTVLLAVREAQEVTLEVFDMLGRRVSVLHRGTLEANRNQTFVWQASGHPSGVYFIRTVGAEFVETRQVTLLK